MADLHHTNFISLFVDDQPFLPFRMVGSLNNFLFI